MLYADASQRNLSFISPRNSTHPTFPAMCLISISSKCGQGGILDFPSYLLNLPQISITTIHCRIRIPCFHLHSSNASAYCIGSVFKTHPEFCHVSLCLPLVQAAIISHLNYCNRFLILFPFSPPYNLHSCVRINA